MKNLLFIFLLVASFSNAQINIAPSSTMTCGGVSIIQFTANPHSFPWQFYVIGPDTNCAQYWNYPPETNTLCTTTFSCTGTYTIILKGMAGTWTAVHTVYCSGYVGISENENNAGESTPIYFDLLGNQINVRYNELIIEITGRKARKVFFIR